MTKRIAAVQVLAVVPGNEALDPLARLLHGGERAAWVLGQVLEGAAEGLRVGVVVADARAAEGGHHAQTLQGGEHGPALHRPAVVGVQHRAAGAHGFAAAGLLDEPSSSESRLFGLDRPADNLAAVDAHDQVQESLTSKPVSASRNR
nr:hypothetical protein [Sorangium cellulosum]